MTDRERPAQPTRVRWIPPSAHAPSAHPPPAQPVQLAEQLPYQRYLVDNWTAAPHPSRVRWPWLLAIALAIVVVTAAAVAYLH